MIVGCLEVTLLIPGAQSLKDKRSVVRRCLDRVRNRFQVAAAEVGDNDLHGRARIGISAVANDSRFVNSVLDKVLDHIESDLAGLAEISDSRLELIHF
ncbi:MAG: DUF503 domain-containing protein [Deltaproteobacteria bacterium]|nr:DUF503 domain-containing protein [Deltaproteobacteria bacterium]